MRSIVLAFLSCISLSVSAQISIADGNPVTQNFDGMGATLSLPANWRMHAENPAAPSYAAASTFVTAQASSGSPSAAGTYNWGTSAFERAVGAMTSGSFGSPNNLIAFYQNANVPCHEILGLSVTYAAERYRVNTAAASVNFFYSLDGSNWTSVAAGDIAATAFPTGASAYNFTAPLTVTRTATISGLHILVNKNFYLRWEINTTGVNSQGIGIDDVSVTATYDATNTPVIQNSTQTTLANAPYSFFIPASNCPWAYSASTLPAGLSLNGSTGEISGTPTASGTYSVSVYGINNFGVGATATISFVITGTSSASDYFRSNVSTGPWNVPASWQSSSDNATWITATLSPTSAANTILIRGGHTIQVASGVTADQVTVDGTLNIKSGGTINLNNGTGDDIAINNAGVLLTDGAGAYASEIVYNGGVIHILPGGKITVGTGGGNGGGHSGWASSTTNIWDNGSVFEWNTTGAFTTSGTEYFPNASAATIPVFRISAPVSAGSGGLTTWNGLLEINANTSLTGGGDKIMRNGIKGTATLTQGGTGTFSVTGSSAVLDGTALTIALTNTASLILTTSVTVPLNAVVTITGPAPTSASIINNTAGNVLAVNGTLDITDQRVTNANGSISVNGLIRTSYAGSGGLYGTNAAVPSGGFSLNSGSTAAYYLNGAQAVTNMGASFPYYNLLISGTGTKTLSSTSSMANAFLTGGTVTVSAGATLDVSNTSFGNVNTNLTLTGTGKFINSGAGIKPDIGGSYSLGTGSTIEFGGTAATQIRVLNYYNLYISGTNTTTSTNTASITLQSGGTFTLTANAVFKTRNANGFSGSGTASINNINAPVIALDAASTVDYSEPIAQVITNQVPYGNLTISATSGAKTAPSGTLTILGSLNRFGAAAFLHNNGTLAFSGNSATTQSINTVSALELNNVTFSNANGGITIVAGETGINGVLSIGANNKLFFTAGYLNLRSSATATASISAVPASSSFTYSGAGRFRIERFVNYPRKWQLLSVPMTEDVLSSTFKSNWMEGGVASNNPVAGYGMIVTKAPSHSGLGFDTDSPSGPSVKSYVPSTDSYVTIGNTTDAMASPNGYMSYVRGDRLSLSSPTTTTNTTRLRTTGKIITGNVTVNVDAGKYASVGNPYASAIDLRLLNNSNVTGTSGRATVYVWDPTIAGNNGLGKFVTLTYNGANYIADNALGLYSSSAVTNFIQSGQAFMVQSSGAAGTVTFDETDKVAASNTVNFSGGEPAGPQTLRVNLYSLNNGTAANSADGVAAIFSNAFSNEGTDDARKMLNATENLSLQTGNALAGIERHALPAAGDSLRLRIGQMRQMKYRFEIRVSDWVQNDVEAYLLDRFTQTKTALSFTDVNTYSFEVTGDLRSSVADRFTIVFEKSLVAHETNPVTSHTAGLMLLQNPVSREAGISVRGTVNHSGNYQLSLVSNSGAAVYQSSVSMVQGLTRQIFIPSKGLSAGLYYAVLSGRDETHRVAVTLL